VFAVDVADDLTVGVAGGDSGAPPVAAAGVSFEVPAGGLGVAGAGVPDGDHVQHVDPGACSGQDGLASSVSL
jgi:hypothetical protein